MNFQAFLAARDACVLPPVMRRLRRPAIWLVTDGDRPGLSVADEALAEALEREGAAVEAASWRDGPRWADGAPGCDLALLRAGPARPHELDAWRDWLALCEQAGPRLAGGPRLIRATLDRARLAAVLARAGLAVPATVALDRVDPVEIALAMDRHGWRKAVVKPRCGAGDARLIERHRLIEPLDLDPARPAVLQACCPEIAAGLWSLLMIEGRFAASLRRWPAGAPGGGRDRRPLLGRAAPPPGLIDDARAVLAVLPETPLHARIDGVARGGRLVVLEVALDEPGPFLHLDPGAELARRIARAALIRAAVPAVR